jgi:hypothetical protein
MRSIFLLSVAAAVLVACTTPSDTHKRVGIQSEFGTASLQDGVYHCVSDEHPNPNRYPKCNDGIPVIVLLKESGSGCLALVPYRRLEVHTDQRRTKVVWKLFGPDGYRFDTTKGIELRRKQGSTDPTKPDAIFQDGGRDTGDKFRWTVRLGAPEKREFDHDASVRDAQDKLCERIDPLIINSDN